MLALAVGTVDAALNWWNSEDDSNLTRMLRKGMVKNPDGSQMKKDDFRIASNLRCFRGPRMPTLLTCRTI